MRLIYINAVYVQIVYLKLIKSYDFILLSLYYLIILCITYIQMVVI